LQEISLDRIEQNVIFRDLIEIVELLDPWCGRRGNRLLLRMTGSGELLSAFATRESRPMGLRIGWSGIALLVLLAWTSTLRAQPNNYEVPFTPGYIPGPLGHPRYELGGFWMSVTGIIMQQTNPMGDQVVATRGFVDFDGSITGTPGRFVGSGVEALNTNQLTGPNTFTPGFELSGGWRFENGFVLSANWLHLAETRYSATATLVPPNFAVGGNLADTFLFSPVYNFGVEYAGQPNNVGVGNLGATFGIWNASSHQTIDFIQRFDQFDLTGRVPIWETDCYRNYALFGPRIIWMFERFKWRTVSQDVTGAADPDDVANYTNTVSQRLYGMHFGGGHDWFLGSTILGALSISVDGEVSLYGDFAKLRPQYELGDESTAASHPRNKFTLVPELEGSVNMWWYPTEAIQVRMGLEGMVFFNTVSSREPIDFNFGSITPPYSSQIRFYYGWSFGVGFVF